MSQSLSKLYVQIIFHIKNSSLTIEREIEDELYAYMASIVKDYDSTPIIINGAKDHVHVLCKCQRISLWLIWLRKSKDKVVDGLKPEIRNINSSVGREDILVFR